MSVWVVTIHMSECKRSVIERIQFLPSSSGKGPTKSIVTESQCPSGKARDGAVLLVSMWMICFVDNRHNLVRSHALDHATCWANKTNFRGMHMTYLPQGAPGCHVQAGTVVHVQSWIVE